MAVGMEVGKRLLLILLLLWNIIYRGSNAEEDAAVVTTNFCYLVHIPNASKKYTINTYLDTYVLTILQGFFFFQSEMVTCTFGLYVDRHL